MKLPNFLLVGAQKCGTTMLHNTLDRHHQIFMSKKKEINFFTNEKYYQKGLLAYSKHFELSSESHLAIGESSPGYICHPETAERIRNTLGDIKIIMIFRDPIRRSLSQYWDNRRHFNERLKFEDAIEKYLEYNYDPNSKGYFSRGLYDRFLNNYESLFSSQNIHVVIFEKFLLNTVEELNKITDFLELKRFDSQFQLSSKRNSSHIYQNTVYAYFFEHPKISFRIPKRLRRLTFFGTKAPFQYPIPNEDILNKLRKFYSRSVRTLEDKINTDLSIWELTTYDMSDNFSE